MRHDIKKCKAVILQKVVFMTLEPQLLPILIDQVHVDFHRARNRQIAKESRIHETLESLIRGRWIAEVAQQ
jgi:hypothetical protein